MTGVSTEWDDIQRKFGNLPPLEKEITREELEAMAIQAAESFDPLAHKTLDELDELEDDLDDQVLGDYRRQRVKELQEQARKARFGDVRQIKKQDFIAEVNDAGKELYVIVHLYNDSIPECVLLNRALDVLAPKHRSTKFLRSVATECIENYPDANLPTILIYYEGECVKQILKADVYGGKKLTPKTVEWVLSKAGAFSTDMEEDPRPAALGSAVHFNHRERRGNQDDDEEDEVDDREYSSMRIRR
eukprot:GILJ01001272.1.p1 GENE.GILJ01001272.1~~GILJ01001272.1.p1  ORF type:complete len:258 (+),score=44.19 GILJ01001272.1:37-774(+)